MNNLVKHSITGLTLFTLLAGVGGTASAQVGGAITRELKPVPISAPVPSSPWSGHWSEQTLASLIDRGLLSGWFVQDLRQTPETPVNVAIAAELLLSIGRFPFVADRSVVDVAVERELILPTDFADGKVSVEKPVSRELFALWTARATGQKMMAEYAKILMRPAFADADQIDGRYQNAIALLQQQGILEGDGNGQFAPKRTLVLAEGIQLVSNTHAKLDATAKRAAGTYKAELPAASSPGRSITLELKADRSVVWSTDYQNGKAPIVQNGTWRPEHPDMLSLRLTSQDGADYEKPVDLQARLTDEGMNVLDAEMFGNEGLQLIRR